MGTGQRRPSRSPRSQRSRSADVDCLKKYTERRVEDRRHTDLPDTSKLDPSKWIPLPKSKTLPCGKKSPQQQSRDEEKRSDLTSDEPIGEPSRKVSTSGVKRMSPTKEEEGNETEEKQEPRTALPTRQARSLSVDPNLGRQEKPPANRGITGSPDARTVATRWIPQINTSRFRCDASALARIGNSYDITKNAAARWMMFAKNSSPCPIPRINAERKPSALEPSRSCETTPTKGAKKDPPKWEPTRKFSPVHTKTNKETDSIEDNSTSREVIEKKPTPLKQSPESARLSQRVRELYDFKMENEWPKRLNNSRRDNTWISKSSSEEDRHAQPVRRNSQDLEFNERVEHVKLRETKIDSVYQEETTRKLEKTPLDKSTEVFDSEFEERLKRFHERLRYSEDLSHSRPKIKERRTYSDDYAEKTRRTSRTMRSEDIRRIRAFREQKRVSEANCEICEARDNCIDGQIKRKSLQSRASFSHYENPKRKSSEVRADSVDISYFRRRSSESRGRSFEGDIPKRKPSEPRGSSFDSEFPRRRSEARSSFSEFDFPKRKSFESRGGSISEAGFPKRKSIESRHATKTDQLTRKPSERKGYSVDDDLLKRKPSGSRKTSGEGEIPKQKPTQSKVNSEVEDESAKRKVVASKSISVAAELTKRKVLESKASSVESDLKRKPLEVRSSSAETALPKRKPIEPRDKTTIVEASKAKPSESRNKSAESEQQRKPLESRGCSVDIDLAKQKTLPPRGGIMILRRKPLDSKDSSAESELTKRKNLESRGSSTESEHSKSKPLESRDSSIEVEPPKRKPVESSSKLIESEKSKEKLLDSPRSSFETGTLRQKSFESRGSTSDVDTPKRASLESRGSSSDVELPKKKPIEQPLRGSHFDIEFPKRKALESRGSSTETDYPKRDSCTSYTDTDRSKQSPRTSTTSYSSVDLLKRDVRKSDASYASVGNYTAKRGSMDYKSSQQVEVPPRRAFSQTDDKPSAGVSSAEFKDDHHPTSSDLISERHKRGSTRYKVYLT